MDSRLTALAEILRLNTGLYRNCLVDLSDDVARTRPAGKGPTNSAAFVAAHLVDSRYWLLGLMGDKRPSPLKGAEGGFNNIEQVASYPPLAEVEAAWTSVGESLVRQFNAATAAQLEAVHDLGFTMGDNTLLSIIAFMMQHESYHLGQLGLLRKHAGLEAMAYG